MILLAIDSAGATCSAALWASIPQDGADPTADRLLAFRVLEPARGQAERLIGLIEAVLDDAGQRYESLGAIAVNHGPGSFTGLRSAVAAARGLALATGLGVVAVSSLEALACSVAPNGPGDVVAALDARRGEVYVQRFAPDATPLEGVWGEPRAMPPGEAAGHVSSGVSGPIRLVGSGAGLIHAALPTDVEAVIETVPLDARGVARGAVRRLAVGERPVAGFEVRPLYLRPPDARLPGPLTAGRAAVRCGAL